MRGHRHLFLALPILLLATIAIPAGVALAQLPQFPNTFYGTATVTSGRPAPVGMVVTAVVDRGVTGREKRYSLAITEPGKFGAPNGLKLKVGGDQQGDIAHGSIIQFFLSVGTLPENTGDIEPSAEVAFFDDGSPHVSQLNLVGAGPDQLVELPNPGQFAVLSAPTLLSQVPTIWQDDPAGSSLIMVYANNQFLILGEPGFEEEIVKPLTAFYITTSSNAMVGFNFAQITGPMETSRDLESGWNLIGTSTPGKARDELAPLQVTPDNGGLVTLHVPNIANGQKGSGFEDWESDGDRDLNANPISRLPDRNLSVLDGYWAFLTGPRIYSKLLIDSGEIS